MIPNEIHYVILKNLNVKDVLTVSEVCKETKEMVDDNTIWKSVLVIFRNRDLTFSFTAVNFYMEPTTTSSLDTILASLIGRKCTKLESM